MEYDDKIPLPNGWAGPRTLEDNKVLLISRGAELRWTSERCSWAVRDDPGFRWHQCRRKPGHGPDSLYCKQHAKKYVREEDYEKVA